MRRLDSLVLRELFGPWAFGVAMFSVLIIAATYLFRLTGFLVDGAGVGTVLKLALLMLPGVMVQTFAMAVLLATLLAFGRLSGDSEIVAIRAAGASVYRIMRPVAIFAAAVAAVAFLCNEFIVPSAAKETFAMQEEIAKRLKPDALRSTSFPIVDRGKNVGFVQADDFNVLTRTMRRATVVSKDEEGKPKYFLYANVLEYDPERSADAGWRIRGGATLTSRDGTTAVTLRDDAWPEGVVRPAAAPATILAGQIKDPQYWSMRELREQIQSSRELGKTSLQRIRDMEYWYWNKVALPLAAFVYGLLGAPLGIRNNRTSTAAGFALSIAIIFGYVTLANLLNVAAMGGAIPAYVASFTPIVVGLIAAGLIMWRRNG